VGEHASFPVRTPTNPVFTKAIETLGSRIEDAWQRVQYDDDAFAEIAQRALTEERLHERYTARDVIREGITAPLTVPQIDAQAKFGQPPVTLFRNARFYVAVLFWVDSTTSVHEHGFSGAFSVLGGASLHVRYGFAPQVRVNSRLGVGKIAQKGASILEHGAVQRIAAGPQGAHALFHLERPSATVLVRTHADPRAQPQLTYHWPCYAIDPFFEDPALGRKCQLLRLIHDTDKDSLPPIASELLASLDLESAIRVLLYLRQLNLSDPVMLHLGAVAAAPHGALGEGLKGLVEAGHHETRLLALRRRVFDRERRLLLAFLLNRLPAAGAIALVARKYPADDPADLVAAWTASLLEDVGGMEASSFVRRAIRLLLAGDGVAAGRRLVEEFAIATDDDRTAATALLRTLTDSPLLATLLTGPTCGSGREEAGQEVAPPPWSVEASAAPVLVVRDYLSPEACRLLRAAYDEGLQEGRFAPHGTDKTDIGLAQVTDEAAARLSLDVAERLRAHFALPPLYIDYCAYTRLRPGGSHPLHSDAVTLDGRPNHTRWRIASAMLYLSDGETDFAGGGLHFPWLGIKITPRVGLLVGFLTTLDYQHEVPPVTSGMRDALAIWFMPASGSDPEAAVARLPGSG
jgi:hypothetical protein